MVVLPAFNIVWYKVHGLHLVLMDVIDMEGFKVNVNGTLLFIPNEDIVSLHVNSVVNGKTTFHAISSSKQNGYKRIWDKSVINIGDCIEIVFTDILSPTPPIEIRKNLLTEQELIQTKLSTYNHLKTLLKNKGLL